MAAKTTKTRATARRGAQRNAQKQKQQDISNETGRAWKRLRLRYSKRVRETVDAIERDGSVSFRDLIALELAELLSLQEMFASFDDPGDRVIERIQSLMLQSRKNLRSLVESLGDGGGVSAQPVRVPEGLRILPRPDEGDDLLG